MIALRLVAVIYLIAKAAAVLSPLALVVFALFAGALILRAE